MNAETRAISLGRGLWSAPGFPHRGWTCVDIEDLEEVSGACEACGTSIRFVHHLRHEDYPDDVGVGCICAGHLEGDPLAARGREKRLRATARRRRAWLTRRWKRSSRGNEFLNVGGFNVVVFPHGTGWSGRIVERDGGGERFLERAYPSPLEAKTALLNILISESNGGTP